MTSDFTTPDGLRLRTRHTTPSAQPRADLVLVHGLGDHVDGIPYTTAADAFAAQGFAVHRIELRGHGRSDGAPAFVEAFADFRRDVQAFVAHVRTTRAARRIFLVGVSLGGLIATDVALHHADDLDGIVAVAPALGETGGSRVLLTLLPVLSRVAPRLRLDPKLDLERLTRDRTMLEAYVEDDPLYQRRITPRLAAEVRGAITATRARAGELRVPLFVLHGTADTVTSPAGSQWFFDRAGVADKSFASYDGALHNLFIETNRDEVYSDVARWIGARC
jgi:alpha-beta hydrolase superfamily lysophospholipase